MVTLRARLHHRDDVQHMLRQERNRLEAGRMTQAIQQRVRTHVEALQAEFKTTEGEIKAHLKAHAHLKAIWQRLQTIAGIGWLTAARLLAHLGEIERFEKVGSLVSLAGLAIKEHSSGSSVRGKAEIDRHGRKDLRQTLYMSALVAKRVSSHMQGWAKRLQAQEDPSGGHHAQAAAHCLRRVEEGAGLSARSGFPRRCLALGRLPRLLGWAQLHGG